MCAVASLRDKTWAGTQCYDSDMTPFAAAVLGKAAAPYVVVYTDADDRTTVGAEVYSGETRNLSLVIEMGIASSVKDGSGGLTIQFADTDQGMEFAVDVLESQVIAALFGDPHSAFGDVLKRLVYRVNKMPSRRGGQAQKGVRFASRRLVFMCNTLDDLPPGVVPADDHPIRAFIALAAAADPALGITDAGVTISRLLEVNAAPTWRQAHAYMGMSTEAALALVPEGTPLPWPGVEQPPFDPIDPNEFVPVLYDITTPMALPPINLAAPSSVVVGSPMIGAPDGN